MTGIAFCTFCNGEIDPVARGTYYLVKGWAQRRATGGANQVLMPHELGEYLHPRCMGEVKRGVGKGQAVMFR